MNAFTNKTYAESIQLLVENYGERTALIFSDRKYTFRQIKNEIDHASHKLRSLGLSRGDKAAIWLPNQLEFIFIWLGASQIGLTAVILNTRLTAGEVSYQLRQSESRAVIVPGDAGEMFKDGAIRFLRRLSDGYKQKGFNVSTTEVEAALERHPGINQAAVVSNPDKETGETGAAFVIAYEEACVDEKMVIAFANEHLGSFKVPAHLYLTNGFPVTAGTEKIQKFKLREQALKKLEPVF